MTAATASATAEHFGRVIRKSCDLYTQHAPDVMPALIGLYAAEATGLPTDGLPRPRGRTWETLPKDEILACQFAAQDMTALTLWERHRTVYDVDPDLWTALTDTPDDTVIPAGLFSQLPHPDPFVAFPSPLCLPLTDGREQRVQGFHLTGRKTRHPIPGMHGDSVQQSTHAPGTNEFAILLWAAVHEKDGSITTLGDGEWADVVSTRLVVPDGGQMGDMIEGARNYFADSALVAAGDWEEQMPIMMRRTVSLMTYLCATNADLTRAPSPPPIKGKGGRRIRRPRAADVIQVGYRVGAALRHHRTIKPPAVTAAPTGRRMPPHVRRAHPHLYWTGPGRTVPAVRWVWPVEVNMSGPADRPTVHRVQKGQRDE